MHIELAFVRDKIIRQTFIEVLPSKFDTPEAETELLAIGLQESGFQSRVQYGGGPARSFWQMERGGGIRGVLTCADTKTYAQMVCAHRGIPPTCDAVYARMLDDDLLGCAFARLLLYSDPAPLPAIGDVSGSWNYYKNNWRPGKPRPADWPANYAQAIAAQAA
jgi:hypothetical protein